MSVRVLAFCLGLAVSMLAVAQEKPSDEIHPLFNSIIHSVTPTNGTGVQKRIWIRFRADSPQKPLTNCTVDGAVKGQIQADGILKVPVQPGDHQVQFQTVSDGKVFPATARKVTVAPENEFVTVFLRSTN